MEIGNKESLKLGYYNKKIMEIMSLSLLRSKLKQINFAYRLNSFLRSYLQDRTIALWQSWYEKKAAELGIICYQEDSLHIALRDRLKARARNRWPRDVGSLHIFLAYCVTNWEMILPKALSLFGRVTAFDWRQHGFDDTAPDWLTRRDSMNKAMLEAFHRAHREQPVDAVVGYLSGHNTAPETLQEMAQTGAAIFNFCWDDRLHFPGKPLGGRYSSTAALAGAVDLNLTNAPESILKYAVHGGLAMFSPEAAHPEVHKPYNLPFDYEVSFVGACYGWRPRFIQKLKRLGVRVECFGKGWPNGPLSDEEMVKLYSRSRINLGFSGIAHSRKFTCLKGRDFEVPMSGGLYLTQDSSELNLVFEVGKEILTYETEEDCARTIFSILADPGRAAAIRQAGHIRCLRDHTYEARWSKVFRVAGILH